MKILQIYNNYKSGGGGETRVVQTTERLLREAGHQVETLLRDNHGISTIGDKISAFVNGIYSVAAKRDAAEYLRAYRPDIVHVHNLYPLFSPSVLTACQESSVPVVMTVHNHGLTCPTGAHFRDGKICQSCLTGHEYRCLTNNCKQDWFQSAGYALRSMTARHLRLFEANVSTFIAISLSIRNQLLKGGYPAGKIVHVPHGVALPDEGVDAAANKYVAYVGGLNSEKGVETILGAAPCLGDVPFKLAGTGANQKRMMETAPANIEFLGWQDRESLHRLYRNARFSVIPSVWWEPFGLVAVEAMSYGLPVIAARSGALEELVEDGVTGLLYDPGDIQGFASCVRELWANDELCRKMGRAARAKVVADYTEKKYLSRLLEIYGNLLSPVGQPKLTASGSKSMEGELCLELLRLSTN